MGLTEPQYSMAFTLASTYTVDVVTSAGSWTATVAAGTYYMDGSGTSDFLADLETALDANDPTGTWTVSLGTLPTGLGGTVILSRAAGGNTITSMTMKTGDGRTIGNDDDVISSGDFSVNTSSLSTWRSPYQARYIWRPRELLTRSEHKPRRTVARSRSVTGRVLIDGYASGWHDRPILIEPVQGALVYQWMADSSTFVAVISGMTAGDTNIALEAFWLDLMAQSGATGSPPTVREAVDYTDTTTYTNIWLSDGDWMENMQTALEEISPNPVLYRVNFQAQTVVS